MGRFQAMRSSGILYLLTAPSGAGKTTLAKIALERLGGSLARSISHTTRPPRKGERDGVDYFFVDDDRFDQMIADKELIEWTKIYQFRYGTSVAMVRSLLEESRDIIMTIDATGVENIRRAEFDPVTIFIAPPTLDVLSERLRARGSDDDDQIAHRLSAARAEMADAARFDYLIVNDDLEDAASSLESIIRAERCAIRRLDRFSWRKS